MPVTSIKRAESGQGPAQGTRLISAKDVALAAAVPGLAGLGWLLPDKVCLGICRAVVRTMWRLDRGRYADQAAIFRTTLRGRHSDAEIDAITRESASLRQFERLLLLRFYRPGGWRPRARLEGREHLDRALQQGRGAILWVKPAAFGDVMTKVACHQAGCDAYHLSRHTHGGFSKTRFGIRVLNAIRIHVERRNLAGRVIIDPDDPRAAIDRLAERLSEGKVVSITVGAEAKRVTEVPFLDGSIPLAGGAANLALKTGAPLLPVFTERRPDGSFVTTIEPPLQAPSEGNQGEKIVALLSSYPPVMEPYFLRLPEQFDNLGLHRVAWSRTRQG